MVWYHCINTASLHQDSVRWHLFGHLPVPTAIHLVSSTTDRTIGPRLLVALPCGQTHGPRPAGQQASRSHLSNSEAPGQGRYERDILRIPPLLPSSSAFLAEQSQRLERMVAKRLNSRARGYVGANQAGIAGKLQGHLSRPYGRLFTIPLQAGGCT